MITLWLLLSLATFTVGVLVGTIAEAERHRK
jgi:hypothetical protein